MVASLDPHKVGQSFDALVNLDADALEAWLDTPESRHVGSKIGDGESVGHAAGRRIVEILRTPVADRSDDDVRHMRKVVGFIRRHRAQEPANMVTSRWRWSLMNWGHDPLQD